MTNSNVRKQLVVSFLCVICSGLVASNSGAETLDNGDTALTVDLSDIDMTNDKGVTAAYVRLKDAAGKVCGSKNSYGTGATIEPRENSQGYTTCIDKALNGVVQSINNDKLTALHTQ